MRISRCAIGAVTLVFVCASSGITSAAASPPIVARSTRAVALPTPHRSASERRRFAATTCSGSGTASFVAVAGQGNVADGTQTSALGGENNVVCDAQSAIGSGIGNGIGNNGGATLSFIGGGTGNSITGPAAFIGAGALDVAGGNDSFAGAGENNDATGNGSFVGAGGYYSTTEQNTDAYPNVASGTDSFVGAGNGNTSSGLGSVLGGGYQNASEGTQTFVGAGYSNVADYAYSFVGGGGNNLTQGVFAFVGAGAQNTSSGDYGFTGAGASNTDAAQYGFIGSGQYNNLTTAALFGSVVGGYRNTVSGEYASIDGGNANTASGEYSSINGGNGNTASGEFSLIVGGNDNKAQGAFAVVAGGADNEALGAASFAAGYHAEAAHNGSFVWSDDVSGSHYAVDGNANEFVVRASGGTYFFSNEGESVGVKLAAGSGAWASTSDRNEKTHVVPLDDASILAKVSALPVDAWQYKTEAGVRHVGPMAQDFYAAFRVGEDDKHITSIDEDGVALAAIKALDRDLEHVRSDDRRKDAEIVRLRATIAAFGAKSENVERRLTQLEERVSATSHQR